MAEPAGRTLFTYIDCVRGYAVMMVITCHVTLSYPSLPYPVRRLTVLGWHGVQLFFLASAVTLLMSWRHAERRAGGADARDFLIRRFFRIAPAYYLAAGFYTLVQPPAAGADPVQLLANLAFLNAWHPAWMSVVPGSWRVVPGGWSVGVEFTFYLIFPLFAAAVATPARIALLFAVSLAVAVAANHAMAGLLGTTFDATVLNNYLYFWFPNQLPVFVVGGALYLLIDAGQRDPQPDWWRYLTTHSTSSAVIALALFASVAYLPLTQWLGESGWRPAEFLVGSLGLACFVLALAAARRGPFVNVWAQAMGKVSFSAYLLHFAVFEFMLQAHPTWLGTQATGIAAIAAFVAGLAVVVVLTFLAAWCTYQAVELPMIAAGRRLLAYRRGRSNAAASTSIG